jgi:ATPase subunit of ABC transporter with duplicated ATPase domains
VALLTANAVSFNYPDQTRKIVQDFSLSVEPGKLTQISGRNGSGKTTALRLLAGELTPVSGEIVRSRKSEIIYLDQKASAILASELTINDHIRAFRNHRKENGLFAAMSQFGLHLEDLVSSFPGQLSGGERQIFALLCALGGAYDILLLDEFTAHLDKRSEEVAFELVAAALAIKTVGVVLVSHRTIPVKIDKILNLRVNQDEN